ncbi:SdrD B-like domain-containing protein [Saccharomonospora sp.]|uniref:SdrD B-like domain-containing protein n=1 Tax=Saccharomonospora sp. TaxID=33913 RepID=UPI0026396925|nr:SdrD B-like domain-containing protein [Saccharomonospora sp.]
MSDGPFIVGDDVPLTVTIANAGDADAHGVTVSVYGEGYFSFSVPDEQLDGYTGAGKTLPAGESVTLEPTGTIHEWWDGEPHISVYVRSSNAGSDSVQYLTLPVVPLTETHPVNGLVYGDADENGAYDEGEGLAGVTVKLFRPGYSKSVKTDEDGRYSFTDVPAGVYLHSVGQIEDGWVGDTRTEGLRVDGSGEHTGIEFRMVRPVSDVLIPTMEFDKDSYRSGETAHMTITLTNEGSEPLAGVTAFCGGAGNDNELGASRSRSTSVTWSGVVKGSPWSREEPRPTTSPGSCPTVRPTTGSWSSGVISARERAPRDIRMWTPGPRCRGGPPTRPSPSSTIVMATTSTTTTSTCPA